MQTRQRRCLRSCQIQQHSAHRQHAGGAGLSDSSIANLPGAFTPGDRTFGCNGVYNGHPAPTGTYVYFVKMKFADGHVQLFKGTVIRIR
ncbi:hypothetical protein [Puia sp.]|uniref:hypothetical protein n=1 Tax=Puia sp. TaxID=2045100 RepID=UPI002F3FA245